MDKVPDSMQKYITVVLGLIPFLLGFALNYLMMLSIPWVIWLFVGFLLVFLWGLLAKKTMYLDSGALIHTLKMNAIGLAVLILVLIQELAVGHYFGNMIGILSQSYFLPFLWPALMIESLWSSLVEVTRLWQECIIAYVLMLAVTYLGSFLAARRR